ncbi:hypothetical protein FB45DRAFT_393600 [Roridomyces roridus]|uniref:Protein kinase domain-containing protein n=1 Tax=Roridomyces roridus TaxID=1738132 RepID=A0AAD7B2N9_9AGAR|nr:hypothetical protein FB45DRAFT_393600 [Roridomyces roridus]
MVPKRGGTVSRRRMFSAKIRHDTERSLFLFEGENAQENCREYIARHANLWHPNVLQIFGVSDVAGTHGVVAHDDLIPHQDYFDLRQVSTILQIYLHALWHLESRNVFAQLGEFVGTEWIRASSGRLCIDLEPSDILGPKALSQDLNPSLCGQVDWNDSTWETKAMDVLSISDFHHISARGFAQDQYFQSNPGQPTDVKLGSVVFSAGRSPQLEDYVEVAFLPVVDVELKGWKSHPVRATIMDDGWTR